MLAICCNHREGDIVGEVVLERLFNAEWVMHFFFFAVSYRYRPWKIYPSSWNRTSEVARQGTAAILCRQKGDIHVKCDEQVSIYHHTSGFQWTLQSFGYLDTLRFVENMLSYLRALSIPTKKKNPCSKLEEHSIFFFIEKYCGVTFHLSLLGSCVRCIVHCEHRDD